MKIFALCNDGTIWLVVKDTARPDGCFWERLPDIPQDEPELVVNKHALAGVKIRNDPHPLPWED